MIYLTIALLLIQGDMPAQIELSTEDMVELGASRADLRQENLDSQSGDGENLPYVVQAWELIENHILPNQTNVSNYNYNVINTNESIAILFGRKGDYDLGSYVFSDAYVYCTKGKLDSCFIYRFYN